MTSSEGQTPDLATILRTLASISSGASQLPIPQPQTESTSTSQIESQSQTHIQPSQNDVQPQTQDYAQQFLNANPHSRSNQPSQLSQIRQQEISHLQSSTTPPDPPKNHIDPATIIDWSSGFRCLTKIVGRNDHIINEVRKLIKNQNEHEVLWFNGRQALIEKQKGREESQKKLDAVLKAVGGTVQVGPASDSPEELAREIETFDLKVYKAQMQMTRETSNALRNMGIPFFGTRSDLIRKSENTADVVDGKIMIDEVDLVKLQRKMLNALEDLCNG